MCLTGFFAVVGLPEKEGLQFPVKYDIIIKHYSCWKSGSVKCNRLKGTGLPNFGGIAQLGERLHGMQEVSGSNPLISTR